MAENCQNFSTSLLMETETTNSTVIKINDDNDFDEKPDWVKSADRITYTWKDINVWTGEPTSHATAGKRIKKAAKGWYNGVKNPSKQILKNVTGVVRTGELVAIMGASGSGKTTLLNALTYRNTSKLRVSGHRCINGIPMGPDSIAALSAYIQQDDLFIGSLTVREHLTFQALLRMDTCIPIKDRIARVEQVLQELGLAECQDSQIGMAGRLTGISGGEMKRLAFASEVLTDPPLLFCDEVTSGLDSYMAENIVSAIKAMAGRGRTIICTIHQPSSQVFALFDRVLLLAEGRVAFFGDTRNALPFFAQNGFNCPPNFNPADFYIQTLAIQPGKEKECRALVKQLCHNFDTSAGGLAVKEIIDSIKVEEDSEEFISKSASARKGCPYKVSWIVQFRALLWRSWIATLKDPIVLRTRLIQSIVMSLLVGVIFGGQEMNQDGVQNINGAMFLFITNTAFQNMSGVIDVFCLELPIFLREHFNGMYRTDVYFLAKMIAEFPFTIFFLLLFISICYCMIGLNPEPGVFAKIAGVVTLLGIFGSSLGYFVSCLCSTVALALTVAPVVILPLMLFSGFLLNSGSIPVYLAWIQYSSFFYYGNEALAIAQWESVGSIECNRNNATCPANGGEILDTLDYHAENFTRDILAMIGLIVFFRIAAFLALLSKTFRK